MSWFHRLGSRVTPLKVTVPFWSPKLEPLILTWVSTGPESGSSLEMDGVPAVTVKVTPLLDPLPAGVTTTFPVVAVAGTYARIFLSVQLICEAVTPLKVTDPELPKLVPLILTSVPVEPELGSSFSMLGPVEALVTVNLTPALATPPEVVTTTFPVVAPSGTFASILLLAQLDVVAVVPLKVTDPPELPKLVPLILTLVPTGPSSGFKLVMFGVWASRAGLETEVASTSRKTASGPLIRLLLLGNHGGPTVINPHFSPGGTIMAQDFFLQRVLAT